MNKRRKRHVLIHNESAIGTGARIEIDGEDVTTQLSGVVIEMRAGEATKVTLEHVPAAVDIDIAVVAEELKDVKRQYRIPDKGAWDATQESGDKTQIRRVGPEERHD